MASTSRSGTGNALAGAAGIGFAWLSGPISLDNLGRIKQDRAAGLTEGIMPIRIVITGGTFDKHYDAVRGELTFSESHLPLMLKQARISTPIATEVCLLKDSLHMTPDDRKKVLEACRQAPEKRIVVVHGTDTMVETARVVGQARLLDKTIVFTGAMIPFSVNGSDAEFNLGCAVMASQLLPAEVYVTMNGQIWRWDGVQKNKEQGLFEGVEPARGIQG